MRTVTNAGPLTVLSQNHWILEGYKERFTHKQWRELLLRNMDIIIFKGNGRRLVAKNLGSGVVEVSKAPAETTP